MGQFDILGVMWNALESIINAFVSLFTGILDAFLAPIRIVLLRFGISVGATGILAPLVFVVILGISVYLMWFFWWAKGFLPKS